MTVGGTIGSDGAGIGAARSIWRGTAGCVVGGVTGVSLRCTTTGGGGRRGTTIGAELDSRMLSDQGATLRMDTKASANNAVVTAAANPKEGQRGPCGCRSSQWSP